MHQRLVGDGFERQAQPAEFGLAHQKFFEQQRMRAHALCRVVGTQRKQFVAQRQQAARLEADDGHAPRSIWRVGRDQPVEFGASVHRPNQRKEKCVHNIVDGCSSAGLRQVHAITARHQHTQCGVKIFALIAAIESVGEQHHLAAIFRAKNFTGGRKHVAPPRREASLGADAGEPLKYVAQQTDCCCEDS